MIKVSTFADKSVVDLPPNFETEWVEVTKSLKKSCSAGQLSSIRLKPKKNNKKERK